ncbi:NnrS family protein [Methylomonas paludis]|uniref:NnrS family protein n=1 Tax=Methylomonas paludis TaxID=1173101 RepID=A0A975RA04_9GAMM|nr:NnrS family protein [Methylomonas paludis]QWF71627.1 NnrS family protein [Methylomonas paludis]
MSNKPVFDYPLFAMGFRVFFALAGLSALALIALWSAMTNSALHLDNYYPASIWHGHEMLLGYAVAVIAGFLLTAIKNWTGLQPLKPNQLAGLALLWLYGRVVPFYADLLPDGLIALIDFSFLPLLAYFAAQPLLRSNSRHNLIFILILIGLALANGLIHAQILGLAQTASTGLQLAAALTVLIIIFVAGRVFPYFTERGLSGAICIRNPLLDLAALLGSTLALGLWVFDVSGWLLALAAFAAVVVNLLRVSGWLDRRILYVPLLWILYIGYGWLILGFALLALSAFALVLPSLALHAFTLGSIGVLTLGMMARVSLGHTGRALKVSNIIALAFVLINLAAVFRVLFPILLPAWYSSFIIISSYCWLAAFSLFGLYYAPILSEPRVDGQPG